MVLGPETLHTDKRIYKVLESTHLSKLRGSKGSVFENELKIRRPKRLAKKKELKNVKDLQK